MVEFDEPMLVGDGAAWQVAGMVTLAPTAPIAAIQLNHSTAAWMSSPCSLQGCVHKLLEELQQWRVWLLVSSRCSLSAGLQGAKQLHWQPPAQELAEALLRQRAGDDFGAGHVLDLIEDLCQRNSLHLHVIGGLLNSRAVVAEVRGVYCRVLFVLI